MNKIIDTICEHARKAYVPEIRNIEELGTETRYFGAPWMELNRTWPQFDGEKLPFVLQIDLSTIPEIPGLPRKGLLSFFHDGDWDEDGKNAVIQLQDPTARGGIVYPLGVDMLPARVVSRWIEVADHPFGEDLASVTGLDEDKFEDLEAEDLISFTVGTAMTSNGEIPEADVIRQSIPAPGHNFISDKLGGWPTWAQGNETPSDRDGNPMVLVFQINAEEGPQAGNVDLVGECETHPCTGLGHVWFSPATGEFAHSWACS
ncbi:DUF1963 domain-containing protein [Paracoccus sp. ME4]|uniref:DUF1963 domain-containing protein n=1 Tax=Paracoccus sp. ME4 TaxID=3138066 RepID=UPI00398BB377